MGLGIDMRIGRVARAILNEDGKASGQGGPRVTWSRIKGDAQGSSSAAGGEGGGTDGQMGQAWLCAGGSALGGPSALWGCSEVRGSEAGEPRARW